MIYRIALAVLTGLFTVLVISTSQISTQLYKINDNLSQLTEVVDHLKRKSK